SVTRGPRRFRFSIIASVSRDAAILSRLLYEWVVSNDPTPDGVDDAQAAAVALTGITAHLGLFLKPRCRFIEGGVQRALAFDIAFRSRDDHHLAGQRSRLVQRVFFQQAMGSGCFGERECLADQRMQLLRREGLVDAVSTSDLLVGAGIEHGEAV